MTTADIVGGVLIMVSSAAIGAVVASELRDEWVDWRILTKAVTVCLIVLGFGFFALTQ